MAERHSLAEIAELIAAHHAVLYRYAYRLTGSEAEAEDMTQQAFLEAQRNLAQLRDLGKSRAWMFAILRNCFRRFLRQDAHHRRAAHAVDLDELAGDVPPVSAAIDREQLQAALDELPNEFRLVLLMYYFEDRSYREIAEELRLPEGTVMSRLSRAKHHLRTKLAEPVLRGAEPHFHESFKRV